MMGCWILVSPGVAQDLAPVERRANPVAPTRLMPPNRAPRLPQPVRAAPMPVEGPLPERSLGRPPEPVAAVQMKRRQDGRATPPARRVTADEFNAFAAQYNGTSSVKLFRLDESQQPYNASVLAELAALAAEGLRTNESAKVQYYRGISHSLHGVVPNGHSYGKDPSVPPERYFHEFRYDREGRVHTVVGHDEDGSSYLTDVILYEKGRPYARLWYGRDGQLGYGDFIYYRGDEPYLRCRAGRNGSVFFMEVVEMPPQSGTRQSTR
jgi:hypothetical protein